MHTALTATATATSATATASSATVTITAWNDPVVETKGHHPRSLYVEDCWLPVVGPTTSWVYRKLTDRLDHDPDGYRVDLAALAAEMGLSYRPDRTSGPFGRALGRLQMFGLAHDTATGYAVRRRLPQLPIGRVRRLPENVQRRHHQLVAAHVDLDALNRAHRIAAAMHDAGDTPDRIEHQLAVIGVDQAIAETVAATVTHKENH